MRLRSCRSCERVKMFSTLVLFFKACDNLFDSGNQQERLVDNSNFNSDPSEIQSEGKSYFLGGFAEGEGSVSASVKVNSDFRFGVKGKLVNELWRRYLLLSGTNMHSLQIPTTRILRNHMPSKAFFFLGYLTLPLFLTSNFYLVISFLVKNEAPPKTLW